MINKHTSLYALPLSALALSACAGSGKTEKPARPNIIFIMTDDHTSQAIGCYGGNLMPTPGMDRLAAEGVRMDNCYATNALSGPSRACILTGKLGHVNGFTDNACRFDGDQQTLPKILQQGGYTTGIVGKWHLISEPQGFDFWSILTGQEEQGDYYNPDFCEMGRDIQVPGYVTEVITDKALEFIQNAPKDKPFFLMMHHKAPHRNWMASPKHLGEFSDVVFPEPENLFDDYSDRGRAAAEQDMSIARTLRNDWDLKLMTHDEMYADTTNRLSQVYRRMPAEVQAKWDSVYAPRIAQYRSGKLSGRELVSWKYQQYMQDYLSTVASVDESISQVLDYLESSGLRENTIVVYTSDQGFFLGEHGWFDKRFMYEECQKMPFIISAPDYLPQGTTCDALGMNIDFAPTFLDMAGMQVPEDMQGASFYSALKGEGAVPGRKAVYYHYYEYPAEHSVKRHYGIRTDRWKLIHFYNDVDQWELYDMAADPHEMHNVYADPANAPVLEELHALLDSVQLQYGDTDPCEKEHVLFKGDRRYMNRK